MSVTASGATAPTLAKGDADSTQKATLIATSITASESTAAVAKYYDKDGMPFLRTLWKIISQQHQTELFLFGLTRRMYMMLLAIR